MTSLLTNSAALNTLISIDNTQAAYNNNVAQLSSGKRINNPGDDPAGLAITNDQTYKNSLLSTGTINANNGLSLVQTIVDSLNNIVGNLSTLGNLAQEATNTTNSNSDKNFLQSQFQQVQDEITRLINSTNFNGISLLASGSGYASIQTIQVGDGTTSSDVITFSGGKLSANLGIGSGGVGSGVSTSAINTILNQVQTAQNNIAGKLAKYGALQNRFTDVISTNAQTQLDLQTATGRVLDANIPQQTLELSQNQVLLQTGLNVLGKATQQSQYLLSLLQQVQ